MMKFIRNKTMILVSVLFFALGLVIPAGASSVAAPTLLKINSFKSYSLSAPVISGVTPANTNVLVYIDDIFAGNAKIKTEGKESDSFYFQAFRLGTGIHKAYLVAEDKTSLVRSSKSKEFKLVINALPAPTLVVPNEKTITGMVKPLIEGFTKSGTFVHLYIDGVYNGKTAIVEHVSGTAHFVYRPFLNLSVGKHKMWAVSEDISGRKSGVSEVVSFNIEEKMPAPTLFRPVVNKHTTYNQPYIVGLAKNNSRIRVFIDHAFQGEFQVQNDRSGTANFAFKPGILKNGKHFVYSTSVDNRGKESIWSNIVYFRVSTPQLAHISKEAVTENKENDKVGKIDNSKNENDHSEGTSLKKEDTIAQSRVHDFLVFADLYENDESIRLNDGQYKELQSLLDRKEELSVEGKNLEKLQKLLASKDIEIDEKDSTKAEDVVKNNASNTPETSGLIDEGKNKQNKLGWNAIIFILFLVAVIAWIFWVNRELIKEKQEQEEKKEDKK